MADEYKIKTEESGGPPPDTTRERIYRAALEEFGEHGLEGARVDRIADAAGINKAMIYYHYHSKEQLYDSVLTQFYEGLAEQLRTRTAAAESVEDYFDAALTTHVAVYREQPIFLKIMLRELASPREELMDKLAATILASGMPTAIQTKLRAMMQSGELRKIDMQQAMVSFVAQSMGYLLLAPLFDKVFGIADREAFLARRPPFIVDLFLHGIKEKS